MIIKSIVGITCVCLAVISSSSNAVVINTLNGVKYEWLELNETVGLSADEVRLRLSDTNDVLYGYEYASRDLFSDLLHSYALWDELEGYHGDPAVVLGMEQFISDFGVTSTIESTASLWDTVDGYTVEFDDALEAIGLYGKEGECGESNTCLGTVRLYYDTDLNPTMVYQSVLHGWDPTSPDAERFQNNFGVSFLENFDFHGSFIVREAVVPIPAAAWLFSSGLIGLVGFARRKKA